MTAVVCLADVGTNEDGVVTAVHDFLGNGLPALFVAARDRDLGAFFGEQKGRSFANAGCAACDQSDSVLQAHAFNLIPQDLRRPLPVPPQSQRMLHRWQDRARRVRSLPACRRDPEDDWPSPTKNDLP